MPATKFFANGGITDPLHVEDEPADDLITDCGFEVTREANTV